MSQTALDIYADHKKYQLEEGTFSETAILQDLSEVKGVFDSHYAQFTKDAGNVLKQSQKPRFLVDSVPTFTPQVTKITINSIEYVIMKATEDDRGIPVLWLKVS